METGIFEDPKICKKKKLSVASFICFRRFSGSSNTIDKKKATV